MVWIVKKGISCLLILLGVTFVTFALMYLAGGDAISYFYENQGTAVSQEIMDAMRKKYGLDQPFLLQYGHWLLHALMGDMGESYVSGRAVLPLIASKNPAYPVPRGGIDRPDAGRVDSAGGPFCGQERWLV